MMELLLQGLIAQGSNGMRDTDNVFMAIVSGYNLNNEVHYEPFKWYSIIFCHAYLLISVFKFTYLT